MAIDWRVLYYETPEGECPLREFIESRKVREQAKILALISYLEEKGPTLPAHMLICSRTVFMSLESDYLVINSEFFISSAIGDSSCLHTHL